jgi:tetratricopeptide (TPR) repeat protein
MRLRILLACFVLVLPVLSSCRSADATGKRITIQPCQIAVTELPERDPRIERLQQDIRLGKNASVKLEQLGWTFVEKARASNDPGFFKLAEQCAECLLSKEQEMRSAALLLRGHALQNLHRFKQAESLARELTEKRGLPADFGLLGDALLEQGKLDEATTAYQKMMDLKPGPQAYARASQMRWLRGDLTGAKEMALDSARSSGPGDKQTTAWALTRLALLELQSGELKKAERASNEALETVKDYAPAVLAQGRILYAQGRREAALEDFKHAASLNPLPEYLWWLADVLREAGREDEAREAEAKMTSTGRLLDPRTYALYLATRASDAPLALALAEEEMNARLDVFTLDALAFAQSAAGKSQAASTTITRALSEGTEDGRLFLHTALIAQRNGDSRLFSQYRSKTFALKQTLLPSELALLSHPAKAGHRN